MSADPSASAAPDRAAAERTSELGELRGATRWMTLLAFGLAPLWLLCAVLRDPGPVWRAQYFEQAQFQGAARVQLERRSKVFWDELHRHLGGGLDGSAASTRWETCLRLDRARDIPFQLVSEGAARFLVDGREQLRIDEPKGLRAQGAVLQLDAGAHRLTLEMSPRGDSLALNASFDGRAPRAVGAGREVAGVRLRLPAGAEPVCP